MKVKQTEARFSPITIILETKEEADALWHALAVEYDESRKDYLEKRFNVTERSKIYSRTEKMYVEFNDIYSANDC